ncbi:helix-hairpin-helix domain-containing protein [Mangrovibacterium sp.]|uniref:helix-hairpin-helix domain-containing protein n=1 Tax=Mangrovibacterium sp. TaxID=1961364 RepID=UPI003565E8E9
MKLQEIIRDYFTFTKGERSGLIFLILIIVFLIVINQCVFYFESPEPANQQVFEEMLMEAKTRELDQIVERRLFRFNPNSIDSGAMDTLDLPQDIRRNILSYRQHGGKFRKASDLRRIYGMNDSIYARLEPYISIDESQMVSTRNMREDQSQRTTTASAVSYKEEVKPAVVSHPIELNRAAAEELERLRGIGPVLSKRIVKYRNLLGGYVSGNQLAEVYGLSPDVVEVILPLVVVDTLAIRKLDLNFMSVDELAAHPYLNFKDAQRIVDFRSKNGYISDKTNLLTDSIIGVEQYMKVVRYLK